MQLRIVPIIKLDNRYKTPWKVIGDEQSGNLKEMVATYPDFDTQTGTLANPTFEEFADESWTVSELTTVLDEGYVEGVNVIYPVTYQTGWGVVEIVEALWTAGYQIQIID